MNMSRLGFDCQVSLCDALRLAAPLLQRLHLTVEYYDYKARLTIPEDLFHRHAPRLSYVYLRNIGLGDKSVPAFSSVSLAMLENVPTGAIGRSFTSLRRLHLTDTRQKPCSVDWSGLSLLKLHIEGDLCPIHHSQLQLVEIPTVSFSYDFRDNGLLPFLLGLSDRESDMALQLSWQRDEVTTVVTLRELQPPYMQRTFPQQNDIGLLFEPLHHLLSRVVDLHATSFCLPQLVEASFELPRLTRLRIDVEREQNSSGPESDDDSDAPTWWGFGTTSYEEVHSSPAHILSCPQLLALEFYALDDEAVVLPISDIANLAHSLGQLQKPYDDRAALDLFGVQFDGAVETIFPRVTNHDFDAANAIAEEFPCFWTDEMWSSLRSLSPFA